MKNEPFKKITISRPKDRSLEAYKAWIMEIAKRLTAAPTTVKWTEEEWIANWKKFWQEKPLGQSVTAHYSSPAKKHEVSFVIQNLTWEI